MTGDNKHSVFKIAANLAAACLVSGIVIGAVYYVTAPVAAQKAEIMQQESMKALVKDADSFTEVSGHAGWFAAKKAGKIKAYIVPSETKGYGGRIKLLVAVTADAKAIDYIILEHNETPGLGDKASKIDFRQQFVGKGSDNLQVVKDKSNTEAIQAMTGATISSRAVTKGVKQAVDAVAELTGGK